MMNLDKAWISGEKTMRKLRSKIAKQLTPVASLKRRKLKKEVPRRCMILN
jgi:hypothetical protein